MGRSSRHRGGGPPRVSAPARQALAHRRTAERSRRIIVQYDAHGSELSPLTQAPAEWLAHGFRYIDEPGTQIDSIWWDCGYGNYAAYPSRILPPSPHPAIRQWLRDGIDWLRIFIDETRRRGLEVFWHHRIAEVDVGADGLEMKTLNPVKAAHPDWVVRTWWWQGLWNLAVPELREYKLSILRELAENYDFDGFQIDFARHVPVLPVGRQWELRGEVTIFMRMVRAMLAEVGERRGRPILLAAKVPSTLAECRVDGFDVAAWAREGLVDMLTLGSRSFEVEVEAFRELVGPATRLYPCIDDHHATDGYRNPPIAVFRGVASNWWQQGADGIVTFNWHAAPPEVYAAAGVWPGPASQQQAYHEIGSAETLRGLDKVYPVERRGGYPWAEGAFGRNDLAQLPTPLRYDGTPVEIALRCGEVPAGGSFRLRVTVSEAVPGDRFTARLNGQTLGEAAHDFGWKDPQILVPNQPEWASGRNSEYPVNPAQRLCLAEWRVELEVLRAGLNSVRVSITQQAPHVCRQVYVEKVELHGTG
ncbi:MAG: family 10 glycosylhydrolase [Armatimonadetes bacterium]|nr:family 10 glycosylhydrolase [Armatimonadota bacterium]